MLKVLAEQVTEPYIFPRYQNITPHRLPANSKCVGGNHFKIEKYDDHHLVIKLSIQFSLD